MTALTPVPEWEEATERRLGIVEQKVDKILDPELGIYPKLTQIEGRLTRWAIGILTSCVAVLVLEFVQLALHK